jgi:hypothetical protein
MACLTCGRCGLEIKIQAAFLRIDNCPRCLARSAIVSPLVLSARPPAPAGWRDVAASDRRAGPHRATPAARDGQAPPRPQP